jgi:hypothetical protein
MLGETACLARSARATDRPLDLRGGRFRGLTNTGHLKAVWPEIVGSVFGRFSAKLGPKTPLERRGSSCSAGCTRNQPPQTNSKATSWRQKIPARLPSGTQKTICVFFRPARTPGTPKIGRRWGPRAIIGFRNRGGGPVGHPQGVQVKTLIINIECLPKSHHD